MTKTVRATPAAAGHGPRMSDQLGSSIGSEHTHTPGRDQELRFQKVDADAWLNALPVPTLTWRRDGTGWVLFAGRRRFGRLAADSKYPGVWRSTRSGARLSGLANLAWAKNAVLMAAERELEWEGRQRAAIAPSNCPGKWGVFGDSAPPVAQTGQALPGEPSSKN